MTNQDLSKRLSKPLCHHLPKFNTPRQPVFGINYTKSGSKHVHKRALTQTLEGSRPRSLEGLVENRCIRDKGHVPCPDGPPNGENQDLHISAHND